MIEPFLLSELTHQLSGSLFGADVRFSGVSTDTRTIKPGDLYVALKGERFDGHEFVEQAIANGAVAIVVNQHLDANVSQLVVKDTGLAYGQISRFNRRVFSGKVVALTGSSGKTSCKEMLALVCAQQGEVLATEANLNNTVGVPKTLLRLQKHHDFAVIEMGANAPGEIEFCTSMAEPDVAMLLNASEAHTQGFGDLQGVRKAKGEIFSGLNDGGIAILNADDPAFNYWQTLVPEQSDGSLSFGIDQPADVRAVDIESKQGTYEFTIEIQGQESFRVWLQVPGYHQVMNALAVTAAATALGVQNAAIAKGLAMFAGVPGRTMRLVGIQDCIIYDDTYNASPASALAAIKLLAEQPGRRILVMGDMAELGGTAERHHREILAFAQQNLDEVWLHGPIFHELVMSGTTALSKDVSQVDQQQVKSFIDKRALVTGLIERLNSNVQVLVKGSRSQRMEEVVNALKSPSDFDRFIESQNNNHKQDLT